MLATLSNVVRKGNSSGNTGWISVPKNIVTNNNIILGRTYQVELTTSTNKYLLHLKSRAIKETLGFYIPKDIIKNDKMIGQTVSISISNTEYYQGKISADRLIRISNETVNFMGIKYKDLYKVEISIDNVKYQEIVFINIVERNDRSSDEYYFIIRNQNVPVSTNVLYKFLHKVDVVPIPNVNIENSNILTASLFPTATIGDLGEDILVFDGNHRPVTMSKYININLYAHYFGCYYADGTKRDQAFSINASTPEQAKYYLSIMKQLIKRPTICYNLTYTVKISDPRPDQDILRDLTRYWMVKAGIVLSSDKIFLNRSGAKTDVITNWNPRGSLRIRIYSGLVLKLHVDIMNLLIKHINNSNDILLTWNFLFGILEGDGFVSGGSKNVGIGFTTGNHDIIIHPSLNKLGVDHLINIKADDNSNMDIKIGLYATLANLDIIAKNVFKYYPKRRKLFIERLIDKSTTKYIMDGEDKECGNKTKLVEKTIDIEKTRNILNELEKEFPALETMYNELFNTYN